MLRTLARNLSSQWLLYLLNVGMMLGVTPMLMHGLGPEGFGVWVIAGNLVAWLMVLDFGVNAASVRTAAFLLRDGRAGEFQALFNATLYLFFLIGVAAALVGLLLGMTLPTRFFGAVMGRHDFTLFFGMLGLSLGFSFWGQAFASILQAYQRFDYANYVKAGALMLRIAGYVWAMLAGHGLLGLAAVTCAGSLMALLGLMLVSRRMFAWCIHPVMPRVDLARRLFGFGWLVLVVVVADQVRFQTDSIIIATYASLPAVALFGVGATPSTVFREVVGAVVSILVPVFSREEVEHEFSNRFLMATRVFSLGVWSAGGIIVVLGGPFIVLWMGTGFANAIHILQVLMVGFLIASAQTMSFSLLYGRAMHASLAMLSVVDAVVNVGLSLWLVRSHGALGVAVGTALPLAISYGLVFPWFVRRALGCPLMRYVQEALLRPMIWGAGVMVAAYGLVSVHRPEDWLSLVSEAALLAGGCLMLGWYLGLGEGGRTFVRGFIAERRAGDG